VKSGVTTGNTVSAMWRQIVLPPGDFVFALGNSLGIALNATAALTMKLRTFDENLNA
jgi:hypothetical protein